VGREKCFNLWDLLALKDIGWGVSRKRVRKLHTFRLHFALYILLFIAHRCHTTNFHLRTERRR
jgi:hypothetical protein